MVTNERALVYSEVYEILNILGEEYKNSIPEKLYKFIKENRSPNYKFEYDTNISLSEQKVTRKTVAFLCMLHCNYWCKSEEEKAQITKILEYNENKKRDKYSKYEENWNKNQDEIKYNDNSNQNVAMIVKKEKNWIEKLMDFVKKRFHRLDK